LDQIGHSQYRWEVETVGEGDDAFVFVFFGGAEEDDNGGGVSQEEEAEDDGTANDNEGNAGKPRLD
jgi:hypothetical protein|tara:strand:+ start:1097 stop:1294 length:198 start_codon:yes stop_codon:yes gene_type:complete